MVPTTDRRFHLRPGGAITRETTVMTPPQVEDRSKSGRFSRSFQITGLALQKYATSFYAYARRWLTVSSGYATTSGTDSGGLRWLPSDLMVGRNGDFETDNLTDDQLEDLGRLEYRALMSLSCIVMAVRSTSKNIVLTDNNRTYSLVFCRHSAHVLCHYCQVVIIYA